MGQKVLISTQRMMHNKYVTNETGEVALQKQTLSQLDATQTGVSGHSRTNLDKHSLGPLPPTSRGKHYKIGADRSAVLFVSRL